MEFSCNVHNDKDRHGNFFGRCEVKLAFFGLKSSSTKTQYNNLALVLTPNLEWKTQR